MSAVALTVGACAGLAVGLLGFALQPSPPARRPAAPQPGDHRRGRRVIVLVPIVIVVVLAAGAFAGGIVLVGALAARRWRVVRAGVRRRARAEAAYPDAIDLIVLAVRAGFLPAAAIEATTPYLPVVLRPAFAAVTARVAAGERFADALAALDGVGPFARPLIDTFAAADRYGLALAPVLERLAFEARQQRRRAADAAARQLPVRLSLPLVLCTLPSFVLLAIVPLLLGAFSSLHVP